MKERPEAYRRPGQPETRVEHFRGDIGGITYSGWRVVHDGPCVYVEGTCSCGRFDAYVLPEEFAPYFSDEIPDGARARLDALRNAE